MSIRLFSNGSLKSRQPQLPRSEPDGQPIESSHLASISYSTLGESTPNTFYDTLINKPEIWEEGLPSRLWIIEYDGQYPEDNSNPLLEMPSWMRDYLERIVRESVKRTVSPQQQIEFNPDASEALKCFTQTCNEQREGEEDEKLLQLWIRARQKVMRLAALCAVADNYSSPVITMDHFRWAENILHLTVKNITDRIDNGSLADDSDHSREMMIRERCRRWLLQPPRDPKDRKLYDNGIVPRRFLQQEVSSKQIFKKHRLGSIGGFDATIKSLIDDGYLHEISKADASNNYKCIGKLYRILGT